MKPIEYNPEKMYAYKLIGMDGTEYIGEYLDMRIDRATIPEGMFAYDCRHDDSGDWVTPITIEERVFVNFAGTFVTKNQISFPNPSDHYIPLNGYEEVLQ